MEIEEAMHERNVFEGPGNGEVLTELEDGSEHSDGEPLDPAHPKGQAPTESQEHGGARASVKAEMERRRERQLHEGIQKGEEMQQLRELERNAADWIQMNDQLTKGPGSQALQSKQEREGLLRQIRLIDPNYGTGLPGVIKSILKRARQIRMKHHILVVHADGKEEWLEKRQSRRLPKPQGDGSAGGSSNEAQGETNNIDTSD